jgi:cell division septum initiation protein DivIVA
MEQKMNSQQDVIYGLMNELEEALDKGFPLLGYCFTVVKKDTVTTILDKLYAALPDEIKEARALLRRKDELQYEAQQRAEKIVADSQAEANRLLSESDLLRAVQREAEKIKEQVIADCEEIKRRALEEADAVRNQAKDDAARTREGASVYAEQVLVGLEQNINQLQEIVKNGQVQLERRRAESDEQMGGNYSPSRDEYSQEYRSN